MRDYLTALATRALAPRETLQPRVPGRFEPVIEEAAALRESVEPRRQAFVETRPFPPLDEGRESPVSDRNVPPRLAASARRLEAAVPGGETPAFLAAERPPQSLPPSEGRSPEIAEPAENESASNAAIVAPSLITRASEPRRPQSIVRTVTRDRVAPPRVIERLRVRREESMAAPPPTPVEITIGRIDVRAVVAAQAPVKPKAQPRVMSLDEYAAKRNGSSK